MIAIIDYGVGNLFSVRSSLEMIGAESVVTSDPKVIRAADKMLLPGVGAFKDARCKLSDTGLDKIIIEEVGKGKKLMGICLGMQMLFDRNFEYGEHSGLGLLQGDVIAMEGSIPEKLNIPHIGWNSLKLTSAHPIFKYTSEGDFVYFVHSYYAINCNDSLLAVTDYGINITAAVAKDNIAGMQFHPEKSGEAGLNILRAFAEW